MSQLTKQEHDDLLKQKPEEATHADCEFCSNEEGDMSKTYDEAEFTEALAVAVKAATEPLKTELETLKASIANGEVEAQINALKTEHETALAAVQAELDAANAAKSAAETSLSEAATNHQSVIDYLAQVDADSKAAAEAEARKDERIAAVAEFKLSEDYVKAQADRWSKMSDEDFSEAIETMRAAAAAVTGTSGGTTDLGAPVSNAFDQTRQPAAKPAPGEGVANLFSLVRSGVETKVS